MPLPPECSGGGHMTHVGAFPAAIEKKKASPPNTLQQSACRPGQLLATVVPSWKKVPERSSAQSRAELGHGERPHRRGRVVSRSGCGGRGVGWATALALTSCRAPPPQGQQVCGRGPPGAVGGVSHSSDLRPPREREEHDGNAGRREGCASPALFSSSWASGLIFVERSFSRRVK